jgi:hypothetical protein
MALNFKISEFLHSQTAKEKGIENIPDAKSLDKDLAYELVSTNQSVFTAEGNSQPAYVPKDNGIGSGLEAILDKYKK